MIVALLLAAAQSGPLELALGEPRHVAFSLEDESWPVLRVRVPPRATALRLITRGATHDVDVYGSQGSFPDPWSGEWEVAGPGVWVDEELLIDVTDEVPLAPGDWYFCVTPGASVPEGAPGELVELDVEAVLVEPDVATLEPGRAIEVRLTREHALRVALSLERADPTARLAVEASCATADVDLLVGPAGRGRAHRSPWARADTQLSWERLELDPAWLSQGAVVHLYSHPETEALETHVVRVRLAPADAPAELVPEPRVPDAPDRLAARPFGPAVAATVSIFAPLGGGSGVVLSADGAVLTNAHVVEGYRSDAAGDVLACGFTLDPATPPVPAFRMRVLGVRRDLDLALLQIATALDGGPLPAGMRFPVAPTGSARDLLLGEPLFGVGFPMTGGSSSYVSVTMTRGILSGLAREREGLVLKTDAAIHSGISGGAVLDERGRLVAVPCSSISDANLAGGIGFALPLELLPAEWRTRIGLGGEGEATR